MQKVRILLADDHETVRAGLKSILAPEADLEVVGEAADGDTILQRARDLRPDVVIMDVSMPGTSGLEATRMLKECCPEIKIIALTRHRDDGYVRELLRAGASGYVLKQSRASELLHAIRAVNRRGTYVDPAVADRLVKDLSRSPVKPLTTSAADLSGREGEVLRAVAWGYSNKEIAARLDVSVKTVETHKANAMQKLGLRARVDVVQFAVLQGWLRDS